MMILRGSNLTSMMCCDYLKEKLICRSINEKSFIYKNGKNSIYRIPHKFYTPPSAEMRGAIIICN